MTRLQQRKVVLRKRGEMARIAKAAKVSPSVVSEWFDGRNSNEAVGFIIAKRVPEIVAEQAEKAAAIEERACA